MTIPNEGDQWVVVCTCAFLHLGACDIDYDQCAMNSQNTATCLRQTCESSTAHLYAHNSSSDHCILMETFNLVRCDMMLCEKEGGRVYLPSVGDGAGGLR